MAGGWASPGDLHWRGQDPGWLWDISQTAFQAPNRQSDAQQSQLCLSALIPSLSLQGAFAFRLTRLPSPHKKCPFQCSPGLWVEESMFPLIESPDSRPILSGFKEIKSKPLANFGDEEGVPSLLTLRLWFIKRTSECPPPTPGNWHKVT